MMQTSTKCQRYNKREFICAEWANRPVLNCGSLTASYFKICIKIIFLNFHFVVYRPKNCIWWQLKCGMNHITVQSVTVVQYWMWLQWSVAEICSTLTVNQSLPGRRLHGSTVFWGCKTNPMGLVCVSICPGPNPIDLKQLMMMWCIIIT